VLSLEVSRWYSSREIEEYDRKVLQSMKLGSVREALFGIHVVGLLVLFDSGTFLFFLQNLQWYVYVGEYMSEEFVRRST
jgi:hypothetical protein